jgi:hypothetical protein
MISTTTVRQRLTTTWDFIFEGNVLDGFQVKSTERNVDGSLVRVLLSDGGWTPWRDVHQHVTVYI